MKAVIKMSLVITLIILFSCEEQGWFVNCSDCTSVEPFEATLEVSVTSFSNSNFNTIIKVFEGNIEDGILLGTYEFFDGKWYHVVKINKKYTFMAIYYYYGTYYRTIDSATPGVRYEKDQCDNPCYFIYDKVVDLRLKYQ